MTYLIIAVTVLLSIGAFNNREWFYKMQFNPYQITHRKKYYKLLSHVFIHVDYVHLFFNMFSFYFFGIVVENVLEYYFESTYIFQFFLLYFGAAVVSSIPSLIKHKDNAHYNAVGASGAVSAIIYAYIVLNPLSKIGVFFIPMPAILFGVLYLGYSYYMAKKNIDNIGHDAHFYGALFGITYVIIFIPNSVANFFFQLGLY